MLNTEEIKRYNRHLILPGFGEAGQEKLKNAKVLVIGVGGLGCPVLQYLTAAGIGEIGVVDFDIIERSNLQRQVLYADADVGKMKAEVAALKLSKQNPFVKITTYPIRLSNKNALDIIEKYDLVIDGSDNFSTRYLVNDACVLMDKPLVYGSIFKFEGQVSVFNYSAASKEAGPTYRCLFPSPPDAESSLACSDVGVLGVLPGIIGVLQATEAIKVITGIGETLSGKLLLFDALTMNTRLIEVERNNAWASIAPKNKEEFLSMDYELFCENKQDVTGIRSISIADFQKIMADKNEIQLIDVREQGELPQINDLLDLHIPLSEIKNHHHRISKSKKVIVFCRSGNRSRKAIDLLQKEFGYTNLYNLEGGIIDWVEEVIK